MTKLGEIAARRIREAREAAGLTQADVAEYLGITRAAVTSLENGRSTLTLQHLEQLPGILGKPLSWFLGIEPPGQLTTDEAELLNLVRALPPGYADVAELLNLICGLPPSYADVLTTLLRSVRRPLPAAEIATDEAPKLAYPSIEDILEVVAGLDQLEIVNVYDYARWRRLEQTQRRESSGAPGRKISQAKREEWAEAIATLDIYLTLQEMKPAEREAFMLFLIEYFEERRKREGQNETAANSARSVVE